MTLEYPFGDGSQWIMSHQMFACLLKIDLFFAAQFSQHSSYPILEKTQHNFPDRQYPIESRARCCLTLFDIMMSAGGVQCIVEQDGR